MKIRYLRAKNFLSIGETPVEIDFTNYGNIIVIKGHNLDAGNGASNASGKTSVLEAIFYGLYGKLLKGLNHKEAINIKSRKGLEVEVHWDDYRVIRRREPNRLQLWKGDEDISLGGIPATDELIRNIIGLDYNSFINVSCFGQHNLKAFLGCDPAEKRQIAENLLSIDKYQKYHKTAKEKLKELKDKASIISVKYQSSLDEVSSIRKKISGLFIQENEWKRTKNSLIATIDLKIKNIFDKMSELKTKEDVKNYEKVQSDLIMIEEEVAKRDKVRSELYAILMKADGAIAQKKDEKQELSSSMSSLEREDKILSKEITELEQACLEFKNKKGGTCSFCYGEITEKNISACFDKNIKKIKENQESLSQIRDKKAQLKVKLDSCEVMLQKLLDGRNVVREKETLNLSVLNGILDKRKMLMKVERPDIVSEISLLEKDLNNLRERRDILVDELDKGSPYSSMISSTEQELCKLEEKSRNCKEEMAVLEKEVPYYEFWVRGFGDDGIRAFVIDEIMPSLNARISYWLQFLMDGKVEVKFNNELDETIQRMPIDHDPFVYNALSGGEHNRIDLAISQAFAHVTMMTSGTCPSLVALDEVGVFQDRQGIQAIYKMICEMARHRQVIVITHDPDLSDLLSGYDAIEVVKQNGITTLRKK